MLRIVNCVVELHDLRLVALAALICSLGCYTALSLLARAAGARERQQHRQGWSWLTAAAAVSGAGVWTTHFVAMLAFHPGYPLGYDVSITLLSIAIAMTMMWAAFAIALPLKAPILGGLVFGAAVGAMHFTGMAAVTGPVRIQWDPVYVHAALLVGLALAATGMRVRARSAALKHRLIAGLLLTLAIAGLHFTAMAAVGLAPDPTAIVSDQVMAPEWLASAIAVVMVLIIALGISGSIVDQRFAERAESEAERLRSYVCELETTKGKLEATTKHLEQALEAAAAASQAKSQFLATMSHELRTPLNAIIGFSEILVNGLFGPLGSERYAEFATSIHGSGRHLLGLINDILDFSKIDAGRLELQDDDIELHAVIREAAQMMKGQAAEAGVRMIEEFAAGMPPLRADRLRIRQILLNLISNSVKFTPSGGELRVSTFCDEGGVGFAVSDTGIGIAPEDIPRALERFGQVDSSLQRKYEGTGLGLTLSKRLAELHGGTLVLESAVGVGTTVTVTLPPDRRIADRQAA